MGEDDLQPELDRLFTAKGKEYGFAFGLVFRDYILRPMLDGAVETGLPPDLEDVAFAVDHFMQYDRARLPKVLAELDRTAPRVPRTQQSGRRLPTAKVVAHGMLVAWFVVERIVPFSLLLEEKLTPGRRLRVAIPWDALAEEWNDTLRFGLPRLTSEALDRRYHRATSERLVRHVMLLELREDLADAQRRIAMAIEELRAAPPPPHRTDAETRAEVHAVLESMGFAARWDELSERRRQANAYWEAWLRRLPPAEQAREVRRRRLRLAGEWYVGRTRRDLLVARLFAGLVMSEQDDPPLRFWFLLAATAPPSPQSEASSGD